MAFAKRTGAPASMERKRGAQAIRARQGDFTGVTCARQRQSFSRMQALCFHVFRESAPLVPACLCVLNALHCVQLIVQASCGHDFTLLLDANGCVFSFGGNEHGQLGHGDSAQRDTPRIVQTLSGNRVRMVAAGVFARCRFVVLLFYDSWLEAPRFVLVLPELCLQWRTSCCFTTFAALLEQYVLC